MQTRPSARPLGSNLSQLVVCLACCVAVWSAMPVGRAAAPRFYSDDPISRDPESQDASKVQPLKVSDQYDLVENSFLGAGEHADVRAGNVNTIDEVPDSSWFTNRVGTGAGPLTSRRSSRARTRRTDRRRARGR